MHRKRTSKAVTFFVYVEASYKVTKLGAIRLASNAIWPDLGYDIYWLLRYYLSASRSNIPFDTLMRLRMNEFFHVFMTLV